MLVVAPDDRFRDELLKIPNLHFRALRRLSRKSLSPFQNFRFLLELYRIFRQEKPALALLYTVKPNIIGNLAAAMAGGITTISVVEGLGYSGSTAARWRWLAAPLYRLSLLAAHKVVFLNRDDAQEFLDKRLVRAAQSCIIHGPGVNLRQFQPIDKPHTGQVVFLFSGRLLSEKGIREFAAAAQALKPAYLQAVFRILGAPDPGNPASIDNAEVEQWISAGFLEYAGYADDVRPALAAADVLVLPSYYREGVPRSVLEAMAMGKIIITTDTPGCRDTVDEGRNGFLIPPRNTDALLNAMRRVLALTPPERAEMGARSIQKVKDAFSDEIVIPQYLALVDASFESCK